MLTIDLTTARRFILGKQGLWPGRRDGRGTQAAGAGFGLVALRERAQQLGGRLEVVTARGVDTTNRRTVPLAGVAYSPWLFWDGRKESLWALARWRARSSTAAAAPSTPT